MRKSVSIILIFGTTIFGGGVLPANAFDCSRSECSDNCWRNETEESRRIACISQCQLCDRFLIGSSGATSATGAEGTAGGKKGAPLQPPGRAPSGTRQQ
jgi:hypothetical protein